MKKNKEEIIDFLEEVLLCTHENMEFTKRNGYPGRVGVGHLFRNYRHQEYIRMIQDIVNAFANKDDGQPITTEDEPILERIHHQLSHLVHSIDTLTDKIEDAFR